MVPVKGDNDEQQPFLLQLPGQIMQLQVSGFCNLPSSMSNIVACETLAVLSRYLVMGYNTGSSEFMPFLKSSQKKRT